MIELKAHMLEVQKLENRAAEKAGLRFLLLDEAKLVGRDGEKYAEEYVDTLIGDIAHEIVGAASLGVALGKELHGKL